MITLRILAPAMRFSTYILVCLCCFSAKSYCQKKALNIAGIHQLVADSKSEYGLQNAARDKQAITTANEQANKTMLARLKNKYRELQERYHTLGALISAANIGIQAMPMLNQIIRNQASIYRMAYDHPMLIGLAYQTEIEFVSKARSLVNYLIGLCASIGAVNQMKASDRKVLFDYVLLELNTIQSMSANLLNSMYYANLSGGLRSLNPFQTYIDQDKALVQEIIGNAAYLK
ncbi:hypothetical protein [Pedobacter sp. GR22-6]|uniref:hypothetical protein n=1 Tax=Pedobacter sp. GR22-6 TaxID=3127957 RepID=UPI00307DB559